LGDSGFKECVFHAAETSAHKIASRVFLSSKPLPLACPPKMSIGEDTHDLQDVVSAE
jgi:hypothetical protein